MIDLKELRLLSEEGYQASAVVVFELLDMLEAAQNDAARYQWIAKQKHVWAVLGDRYNMPEIDEGATTFEESIDIAMASKS